MKTKLKQFFWNKVIRNSLIASFWFLILSQLAIFIWSKISNINFFQVYQNIFIFLSDSVCIKLWVGLIIIFLLFVLLYFLFKGKKGINKEQKTKKNNDNQKIIIQNKAEINEAPTVFFHYRFCDAFPGFSNGFACFYSRKDIHNRLKILLTEPIAFEKGEGHGIDRRPIWWFRGTGALPINKFKILSRKKALINIDELIIEKIIAYRGRSYYEDFVYVQCSPDKPIGLYDHNQLYIESRIENDSEYSEEFGIYKKKFITRQEYDDGSAIIKGKPVRTIGAELRTRSLIKYNFIIAAKFSPYNCQDFSRNSGEYFGRLLRNEIEFDNFVKWMNKFPKNRNDY